MMDDFLEAISENDLSEEQIKELVNELSKEGASELHNALMQSAPSMLADETASRVGFEERNYLRWKKPLDLLMVLWRICEEVGEDHAHSGPREVGSLVFDTLAQLHPRALLVASEIMCLLVVGSQMARCHVGAHSTKLSSSQCSWHNTAKKRRFHTALASGSQRNAEQKTTIITQSGLA